MMGRSRRRLLAGAFIAVGMVPSVASAAPGSETDTRLNETSAWPAREVVLSLPAKRILKDSDVAVVENGLRVDGATVTSAASDPHRGVVLVIDTSLTMRGEPIRQAMIAAQAFASHRSRSTPLGVIFFSGEPRVALRPTTNPVAIRTTLGVGPALTRGTRIFDAAAAGINALHKASLTSGSVVVLSDGAEAQRGSSIAPEGLAALAKRSGVRIFSVGLDSRSFSPRSLEIMSALTGGRYGQAARPKDLPPIFNALGERLSSEYLVRYRSTVPAGTPVLVHVGVSGNPENAALRYTAPNFDVPNVGLRRPHESSGLSPSRVLVVSTILFVVLMLAFYLIFRPERRSVISRVGDFSGGSAVHAPTLGDVREVKRKKERKPSARWERYRDTVELAGLSVDAANLALATVGVATAIAAYAVFAAKNAALLLLVPAVPVGVRMLVSSRLTARRRAFEDQLPDNLQVLASGLRAGYSFSAAMAAMADDADEPSRTEFLRASTDEQLGVDVAAALHAVGERMDSPETEYVGIVARMQRESGGNTADVLEQVIETVRERQKLKRMVSGLTAQGRFGGAIVSAMPVVVGVGMAILNPGYFDPMFHSVAGILLLAMGVIMLIAGWLVIRKVVNVEP
ncbi:type II secretion system F family protein [Paraconexibacter antarcticus]|uniref:Type II secretion system F family protein n=1 Tax=Paraconexibacter antarcticus TaxID=2949664 RepID=A0ABY5DY93_9ACTN|nr:type II secretion system F family protein [Paraconexibacter antarcticus]UTI65894.1 type II secretion system F family protein [Paraconexibacter antarcticus]